MTFSSLLADYQIIKWDSKFLTTGKRRLCF